MAFSKKGGKLLPACTPLPAASSQLPTTLQQLLGAFSSPTDKSTAIILFLAAQPRHRYRHRPYSYCYRLLLRLNPLTSNPQHHMSSGTNADTTAPPTNHVTTTMQPRPSHGGFPGKPRTLSLFPLLFSPARNTYPTIIPTPLGLGSINHIAITTTAPRPTHGGYPPPALHRIVLHHPANHPHKPITVHTLALSKEEEEGEGGARPPPQVLPTTHPPPVYSANHKIWTAHSSQPLSQTPKLHYPLPLLIIGECRLVQQHPLSLPTRAGFRNNGGLDLSGLRVLALPPPAPPCIAMPLDCGGQPPHTWHEDLCRFLKLCFNAVWTG